MKNFNLTEALAGKPVKLKNGFKAIICYRIPDEFTVVGNTKVRYPILGICLSKDGYVRDFDIRWNDLGQTSISDNNYDIVGMWDDLEKLIEKAYNEKLYVKLRNGSRAFVWFKIPDDYVYSDHSEFIFNYKGIILEGSNNFIVDDEISWTNNGKFMQNINHKFDIVGLWEE